uniref:PWWP domain-containing protein n=1 Tax=Melopsittacus undulatus TaxID=13146 RepID=A0A8V5H0V6_MELUD
MTDQEYILCTWRKRLWPAKVKQCCDIFSQLCCVFRISVSCADVEPLKEEHIVNIASNLGEEMSQYLLPCIYSECNHTQ